MRAPIDVKKQPHPVELIRQDPVFRGHLKVDELHLRHALFAGGMSDDTRRNEQPEAHQGASDVLLPAEMPLTCSPLQCCEGS